MLLVIILHINAHYMGFSGTNELTTNIESLINVLTRVSVPCFVMLSGAFLLNKEKNKNFRVFYSHAFYKTTIPFIAVSILLLSFSFVKVIINRGDLLAILKALLIGDYYNLWYMFMLLGLYFFTPIIIIVKERISSKAFGVIAFIWLAFSVLFQSFTTYLISYSFGVVFAYMGYFMVGNVLYNSVKKKRNGWIYILTSIGLLFAAFFIRQIYHISIYSFSPYASFFSPLVVISSVLFFIGYSKINLKISFGKLPIYTFYIYLFHTAVYEMVLLFFKNKILINPLINIIMVSIITFVVSLFLAVFFYYVQVFIYKKFNINNKIQRLFKVV